MANTKKTTSKIEDNEYAHVEVQNIVFDEVTGEPIGKPFVHTVNRRSWPRFVRDHQATGLTILKVLHLPDDLAPFDPEKAYKDPKQKNGGPVYAARKRVLALKEGEK